jgi:hypothetical protein
MIFTGHGGKAIGPWSTVPGHKFLSAQQVIAYTVAPPLLLLWRPARSDQDFDHVHEAAPVP